jgi:hypothetical protein
VRCAGCRYSLGPRHLPGASADRLLYGCRKYNAGGACCAPTFISASKLEPYVIDGTFEILRRRRRPPLARRAKAEAALAEVQHALERYRDNDAIASVLGNDRYLAGLAVRQERVRDAALVLATVRLQVSLHDLPSVAEVRACWSEMSTIEKRRLIARVIDVALVHKGTGPASERVILCPLGTGPRVLPHAGRPPIPKFSNKPRRGWLGPGSVPPPTLGGTSLR